jgi:hypothetical protein
MTITLKESATTTLTDITIVRVNTDKTRKDLGSESIYHVYFELSGYPPVGWIPLFQHELRSTHPTAMVSMDGTFLILHCPLAEVGSIYLPALKRAVAAANAAFDAYALTKADELETLKDVWKHEREDVEGMAISLRFD